MRARSNGGGTGWANEPLRGGRTSPTTRALVKHCQQAENSRRGSGEDSYPVRVTPRQDIFERSLQLAKQLRGFGLDARPYENTPLEPEIFTVAIESRQIRPWAGAATFQVVGDAKRRQAVVNVSEAGRQITREYHVSSHLLRSAGSHDKRADIVAHHFPVFVPGGHMTGFAVLADHRRQQATKVRATMDVPKSSTHLLMGYDEVRQFIAALPARASTVAEAHVLLRPQVSQGALRQGEWFFDPATAAEFASIRRARKCGAQAVFGPLEPGSSHRASVLLVEGQRFAIGKVVDNRVGHHRPVLLTDWHRVVRNSELGPPARSRRRAGMLWD